MIYVVDGSWRRHELVVVAGSPLTIFRLTAAGRRVVESIERAEAVPYSTLTARLLNAGAIHPVVERVAADVADGVDLAADVAGSADVACVAGVTIVTPQLGGIVRTDGRITVDDGSRPPLDGAAVRLAVNRGPAGARNAARPMVATEFVAFVDADVEVDRNGRGPQGWVRSLLGHFDDPAVGLVAPRVLGEPGSSLDMGTEPARVRAGCRVSYVPAAAVIVRVAALDDVGWFDEQLRFGEDVDLVWRLDERGWVCRYEPAAAVWHEPRHSFGAMLAQQIDYGGSAAPLAIRHPGALAPLRVNGWTAGAWVLASTGHVASAAALALGSAAALPWKLPDVPVRPAVELALAGHLAASQQMAAAVRRVWWPLVALAALRSRRARFVALLAVAMSPTTALRDAAYGVGVWRGMIRHRTIEPIVPTISAWPGRSGRQRAGC